MTDEEKIIEHLKSSAQLHHAAVKHLCTHQELRAAVYSLIKQKGGSKEDAEDIFWQAIQITITNICRGKFDGDSSIKTYLVAVAKNIFFKQPRQLITFGDEQLLAMVGSTPSPEDLQIAADRDRQIVTLFEFLLTKLSPKCRKLFELLKRGSSMSVLAEEMGLSQIQSAQNATYRCREKLRSYILEDDQLRRKINSLL